MYAFKITLFALAAILNAASMALSIKFEIDARRGLKTPRVSHARLAREQFMIALLWILILVDKIGDGP